MRVHTVRELGAQVRAARRARGMTQADLANRLRVSRDWVVRLEQGSPRLETQKVLDALSVLGLTLEVADTSPARALPTKKPPAKSQARSANTGRFVAKSSAMKSPPKPAKSTGSSSAKGGDPFDFLKQRTS